ncbi:MAG TPA: APC family permease [Bryobacteraceae bacterium]|nr:APC family permease [Bryobacteraceae bacterium]
MSADPATLEAKPQLKRALGPWDLTFLCVVAIANLNLIPVIAANGPITVWLWLAALIFFLLPQGITVIELAHRHPAEGGLYVWTKDAFGDFHGFMCGWAYWTTNMFYLPTLLFYLGGILAYAGPARIAGLAENRVFFFLLTTGLLWLTALLNIRGIGVGKWVNNSGGWGTMIGAAVLVSLAVAVVWRHGVALPASSFAIRGLDWSIMSSFGVICFGLVGLELGPVMGDEIRDPQRSIPQGTLRGGVLAGLIYVAATLALLLAVPQHEVKVIQGVLQAVDKMTAMGAGERWMLTALAVVLAIAIAGSTSAWLGGSARIIFVSGIDRYMPKALGKVHPKFATPHVALLTIATLSSLLVTMSFIGATVKEAYVTLLDLSVLLQMISYLYLFAALAKVAFSKTASNGFYGKAWLRFAALGGLAATILGGAVAFVPPPQVDSIWRFELKMAGNCIVFFGLAAVLFWCYSRRRAA